MHFALRSVFFRRLVLRITQPLWRMVHCETDEAYTELIGTPPTEDTPYYTECIDGQERQVYSAVVGVQDAWVRYYESREIEEQSTTVSKHGLLNWQHAMQRRMFENGSWALRKSCWQKPVPEVPPGARVHALCGLGLGHSSHSSSASAATSSSSASADKAASASVGAPDKASRKAKDAPGGKSGGSAASAAASASAAKPLSALGKAFAKPELKKMKDLRTPPATITNKPALSFKRPQTIGKTTVIVDDDEPLIVDGFVITIDDDNESKGPKAKKPKSSKEDGWRADIEALRINHIYRLDELITFGNAEEMAEKTKGIRRPRYHRDKLNTGRVLKNQCI